MALVQCEECGKEISDRASACPHCGCPVAPSTIPSAAPPSIPSPEAVSNEAPDAAIPPAWRQSAATVEPSRTQTAPTGSNLHSWIAIGVVLLVFVVALYSCATASGPDAETSSSTPATTEKKTREVASPSVPAKSQIPSEEEKARQLTLLNLDSAAPDIRLKAARFFAQEFPGTPEGNKAASMIPELEKALEYERSGGQWRYDTDQEGMSGKATRYARVESTNTINLDFPYSGAQHATLMLRRHPRWGNDVVLSIEKGQILCHSYGDCSIGVRFDDGKIIRLKGNPPADNSTESLFIPAFSTFLKQLPGSKTVKIEIQVYQGGAPVFEFDVSGFKSEKFK